MIDIEALIIVVIHSEHVLQTNAIVIPTLVDWEKKVNEEKQKDILRYIHHQYPLKVRIIILANEPKIKNRSFFIISKWNVFIIFFFYCSLVKQIDSLIFLILRKGESVFSGWDENWHSR